MTSTDITTALKRLHAPSYIEVAAPTRDARPHSRGSDTTLHRFFSWGDFCRHELASARAGDERDVCGVQFITASGYRLRMRGIAKVRGEWHEWTGFKITGTGWHIRETRSGFDLGTAWGATLRQAIEQAARRLRMRRPSFKMYRVTTQAHDVETEHDAGGSRSYLAGLRWSTDIMRVYAHSRGHACEIAYGLTGAEAASHTVSDALPAATAGPVPLALAFLAPRPPRVEALPA